MASTYSTSLKLELIGNGDQSGTWGTTTNNNLGTLLEQAITGVETITMFNTDYTLTNYNGASDEARNAVILVQGTNSAVRNVIAPAVNKVYIISNQTTGGFAINIKTAASTGIQIPNGATYLIYCDSSEFYAVTKAFASTNTPDTLVLRDGSGNFSAGTISANLIGNLTTLGPLTANGSPGTAGQFLTSRGAGLSPEYTTLVAFVSGMIMLWSGSVASIPSGWLLCDGSNSTPDLRNRFVVGAGSTYAVGDTGGSADAVVVSHTHTAVVTDPGHTHSNNAGVKVGGGGGLQDTSQNVGVGSTNVSTNTTGITVANSTEGVSGTNANLPPYYALCYIMKS
jgi:hypothetical protein